MCESCPYPNDVAMLDDWFEWLKCRARRVAEDRSPPPVSFPIKPVDPQEDWGCRERVAWNTIETRLEAHRQCPEAPVLGLERLRDEHDLDTNDLLVLVACTAVAISQHLAEQVLGDLCGAPFGVQIEDCWTLLDPCCKPWGLEQYLAFRQIFRPGGRLVGAELITVEIKEDASPAEVSGAWVQLTGKGFQAITGVAS
jgi:hypothetical protein